MNNIENQVISILKEGENNISRSQFYKDYQKFASDYNSLIERGFTSKRQSQLRSISDENMMAVIEFNSP
jgi:hypothetical protein